MFSLLRESVKQLNPIEIPVLAAALAFYALLSLAPLVIISIAIAGLIFSQSAAESQILAATAEFIGKPAAVVVQDIIRNISNATTSGLAAALSFLFLLYAASRIFWQLRISLHTIWALMPKAQQADQYYQATIKDRLLSIVAVLVVGVLLLAAMLLNALAAGGFLGTVRHWLAGFEGLAWVLSFAVAPALYMLIFAAIFKWLPNAKVSWSVVWPGAALTACLFWIGGYIIWWYLVHRAVGSVYGAAGSLVIFMLWTYASAWIFLFGAKFTQVYAGKHGTPIVALGKR